MPQATKTPDEEKRPEKLTNKIGKWILAGCAFVMALNAILPMVS